MAPYDSINRTLVPGCGVKVSRKHLNKKSLSGNSNDTYNLSNVGTTKLHARKRFYKVVMSFSSNNEHTFTFKLESSQT